MSVDVGTSKGCSTSAMEEAAGGIGEAAWGTESGLDDSGDQDTLILGDATSNDPIDLIRGYCKVCAYLHELPSLSGLCAALDTNRILS